MMDSRDTKYSYFTEEEQVERYAKMLLFWDTNKPEITHIKDMMNNPRNNAKLFYIADMRSKTYKQILEKIDERVQKLIGDKYNELLEIYNENKLIENFTKRNKYPSYKEVLKLLSDDITVRAEYGERNHEWIKKIWENMHDDEKIKVVGKLIHTRGGFQAMLKNHDALMKVVRHFLQKQDLGEDANTIQLNIYKIVEQAWHGIGQWLC